MDAELSDGGVARRDNIQAAAIQLTLETGGDLSPPAHSFSPSKSPTASSQQSSFYRRHSYNPAGSKPLRSSPLAGPVVSSDGSTLKPPASLNDRRHRTSSHPDLATLTPPPPASHNRPRSSQGFESEAGPSRVHTLPIIDVSGLPDSPSRFSFFSGLEKRRSKRMSASSSIGLEVPPIPSPPVPDWALQHQSAHNDLQRRPKSSHADLERSKFSKPRPKSTHGYPIPNGSGSSLTVPVPPLPRSFSHSPQEASSSSWMTTNTYDSTPKFSRLGLAASNVVLPVSARERKRSSTSLNARVPSASSITSSRSRTGMTYPSSSLSSHNSTTPSSPPSPSLSLTRSTSASSDESLRTATLIPGSNATSSLSLEMATIVEEQASTFTDPRRTRTFSISSIRKGTISRITRHRVKRSRSFNDAGVLLGRGPDGEAKVPSASENGVSAAPDESKLQEEKGNEISKKQGTIRRLWRKISGKRWGRSPR
ncbi:hypothetical protein BDQ17DRAFT_1368323 [Cyathus striatus]|nr:hypothetical protein BDQ17DRAFT_1368323 [Cyathus striatus]